MCCSKSKPETKSIIYKKLNFLAESMRSSPDYSRKGLSFVLFYTGVALENAHKNILTNILTLLNIVISFTPLF